MKKIFIGIIIGVILCGIAYMVMIPKIKQAAHDSGFSEGNKSGITTGTAVGINEGIAQCKEEQRMAEKRRSDSAAAVRQKMLAKQKAAALKQKREKPVQNWHIIDGKIADPIPD